MRISVSKEEALEIIKNHFESKGFIVAGCEPEIHIEEQRRDIGYHNDYSEKVAVLNGYTLNVELQAPPKPEALSPRNIGEGHVPFTSNPAEHYSSPPLTSPEPSVLKGG